MLEICGHIFNNMIILLNKEVIYMGGTISSDKTRTQITIEKELKSKLEVIAKSQNRSFNNLVITILKEYVEEK
jgi:fructose-1,6-bisphosphatase/sedoheptulose 1,7-bisphosphatase-like protein